MANISRYLSAIKSGRWGKNIRMPIHDALKAIADETPAVDDTGPWYIIDSDGEFIVTDIPDDYVIAEGIDYYYVVAYEGEYIVSDIEDDYCQAKE